MNFYYIWEDGSISFVAARNRKHAAFILDEIGDADPKRCKKFKGELFTTLRPKKEILSKVPDEDTLPDGNYFDETYEISENMSGLLMDITFPDGDKRSEYDKVVNNQ